MSRIFALCAHFVAPLGAVAGFFALGADLIWAVFARFTRGLEPSQAVSPFQACFVAIFGHVLVPGAGMGQICPIF